MKKLVYALLLILVLGGAGFYIYSRNKSKNTPVKEYGILSPNPSGGNFAPTSNNSTESIPVQNNGKVLGETAQAPRAEEKPAPESTPVAKPKPATPPVTVTNGLSTYRIAELSFEVQVPNTWQPRLEAAAGNVLAFYTNEGQVGQIEVVPDAQQSFDALMLETQSNPNISGIQQTTVQGQKALVYNDARYNGRVIAFVYKGNIYYLRGASAQSPYLSYLKLL